MNSLAQAFVSASIRNQADVPHEPEAPMRKPRNRIERETVLDGGGRVCELNTKGAGWNDEFQTIGRGQHVRPEGAERGEYVNFVVHGSSKEKIGQKLKCFFQIDRLEFDDGSVYHEVVLRPNSFAVRADTRVVAGPKRYAESDIELATGGFIAVVDLSKPDAA